MRKVYEYALDKKRKKGYNEKRYGEYLFRSRGDDAVR